MKELKQFLGKYGLLIVLLLTCISVGSPFVYRLVSMDGLQIGEESYLHLRIGETFYKQGLIFEDPLIYSERTIGCTPYHIILYPIFTHMGFLGVVLVQLSLALLSTYLFFRLGGTVGLGEIKRTASTVLLVVSPVYIALFGRLTPDSMALPLLLLSLVLFQKKRAWYVTSLSLIVLALISIEGFVLTSIAMYMLSRKQESSTAAFFAIITSITAITVYYSYLVPYASVLSPTTTKPLLSMLISGLGAQSGMSIFLIVLAIIGIAVTRKMKHTYKGYYLLAGISLLGILLYGTSFNIYFALVLSLLGAQGLNYLLQRKWEIVTIKQFTFMLIACGLLFSMVSFEKRISLSEPFPAQLPALEWLAEKGIDGEVVLSHPKNGHLIQYFAEKKVVLDTSTKQDLHIDDNAETIDQLFSTRTMKTATSTLDEYDIRYILIDRPMKEGLIWKYDEDGLLFLLSNKDVFTLVYSDNWSDIYQYTELEE